MSAAWFCCSGIHSVIRWWGSWETIMEPDLHFRHRGGGGGGGEPSFLFQLPAAPVCNSWKKRHYLLRRSTFLYVSVIFYLRLYLQLLDRWWRDDSSTGGGGQTEASIRSNIVCMRAKAETPLWIVVLIKWCSAENVPLPAAESFVSLVLIIKLLQLL